MIPRKYRLKSKGDFQKIFEQGKTFASPYFVVYNKECRESGRTRIGFAVSRKLGTAVTRNKIKRRMREAIRPLIPNIKDNNDIVIVARSRIKQLPFREVESQMKILLNRACLLDGDKT